MPWSFIGTIISVLFNFWGNRAKRSKKAQQQIAKLSHRMDTLAKSTAKLRQEYADAKKDIKEPLNENPEVKQQSL